MLVNAHTKEQGTSRGVQSNRTRIVDNPGVRQHAWRALTRDDNLPEPASRLANTESSTAAGMDRRSMVHHTRS